LQEALKKINPIHFSLAYVTKRLKAASETLGIKLLDHIIFNHKGYYSFLKKGEI